jgi:RNA polymerase sigma factor (TIGR02999 family)
MDVSEILAASTGSDQRAASRLAPLVYGELRAIASRYMRRERPDHTLQTTALVHEAYLRLIDVDRIDWQSRTHFLAVAARQMRRVLINHARDRRAGKRGGGQTLVTFDDAMVGAQSDPVELLTLCESMERLAEGSPRQARVAEMRLFAGLKVAEIARVLGVSERTVKQDWTVARAWLRRALGRTGR